MALALTQRRDMRPSGSVAEGRPDPFRGVGVIPELMRTVDWARTALGPVEGWPQSLRTALSICLGTSFPMMIAWGTGLHMLYNEAYVPVLGSRKHPEALGQPLLEVFPEIRELLADMFGGVMASGSAVGATDMMFPIERHGFIEETYFVFSYSPIRDESGRVGGVLTTCTETTERVLAERRLRLLRELDEAAAGSTSGLDAALRLEKPLAEASRDLPFTLLYLLDDDGSRLTLAARTGMPENTPLTPPAIDLADRSGVGRVPWPVADVVARRTTQTVEGLSVEALAGSPWPEPVSQAVVLPIGRPGTDRAGGLLVAGVSPRLPVDPPFRAFLDLVAEHIGSAITAARAYADERRRAEALAELDRAKTAFFSDVSHEFRTPLTLLLAPLETALLSEITLPEPIREELRVARRNANRLLKLVNSLLDFSRIEAGRIEAVYEPVDLAELTSGLASAFRAAIERAGLWLVVDCPSLPQPVHVDREMWEKIVLNLVSNAFKFTLEGGVSVSLRAIDAAVELRVTDTGVGIPVEEQPRVFERFHRVRGTRARTHEGSGIGLALVQELVRLHGGTVELESRPDVGSTFTVRIPFGTAHLPADHAARSELASTRVAAAAFTDEALRWLPGSGDGAVTVESRSPAGRPTDDDGPGLPEAATTVLEPMAMATRGARILIVDDNADMRDYLARLVTTAGWVADLASDGEAALARATEDRPDLIVADVMMPRLDGIGLVRALRSGDATRELPVVLLSARAGEEARVEGLEAGANDYLVKPFAARELVARLAAQVQLSRHRRELATRAGELLAVLEAMREAVVVVDAAGRLVLRNAAADDLLGHGAEAVGDVAAAFAIEPRNLLQAALDDGVEAPLRSDPERWVEIRAYPVSDGPGCSSSSTGSIIVIRDISAERRARTLRDAFIGLISHELRTPITTIYAGSKLLARGEVAGRREIGRRRDRRALIADIEADADRLFRLVEDLLILTRLERGAVEYLDEPVLLQRLLPTIVASEASRWPKVTFDLRMGDNLPAVRADATFVEQIARNLLANAAKYSDGRGRVEVAVTPSGPEVVVCIRDDGPGIPAAEVSRIFDLFYRAPTARPKPGAGIGLFVARRLTELMGGRIWAQSDGSTGSEFSVALQVYAEDESPASGTREGRG